MSRLNPYVLVLAVGGVSGCAHDKCDPVQQTGCDDGTVCEEVQGGDPKCFQPVAIEGKVFDLANQDAIEGARIVGVDVNGAAQTNVVTSAKDGTYKLPVPTMRDKDGNPINLMGQLTLRADAVHYESFPGTVRQSIPIDVSSAVQMEKTYVIKSTLTDVAMSKLADGGTAGRIEGKVDLPADITGAVVVAQDAAGVGYATIAARNGDYAILNVPNGDYTVQAYLVDHNYTAGTASVAANTVKVDLTESADAPSTVSGQVSIVNGNGYSMTSVVLFIESTYDKSTGRGVTVPGLRAPRSGPPTISGAFTMDGVPGGKYVIVAAFENDGLVRDPDQCIAGTADVHIDVPVNAQFPVPTSFKITGALDVIGPGATMTESVSGSPTFSWVDDSSENQYVVDLFNAYGEQVWTKTIPGVSGGTPTLAYDGPALLQGMYYQFRVTSQKTTGGVCNISRTEDLKGVFYLP